MSIAFSNNFYRQKIIYAIVRQGKTILTELGTPASVDPIASTPPVPAVVPAIAPSGIVEAQSWVIAPNGKVRLVAMMPTPASIAIPAKTQTGNWASIMLHN